MFVQHKKIAGFLLSACVMPALSWAAELQNVRFAELPGEKVELRLQFDELPSDPAGYTIEKPARIVLDFDNTDNTLAQKKFAMNIGDVSSAVVVSSGGRTRLIVNMDQLSPYTTRKEGNEFIIEVGSEQSVAEADVIRSAETTRAPVVAATTKSTNKFDRAKSTISSIDFRRGETGEGRIIVQLTNPNVSIDIEEVAGGIDVSFMQTALPDELRRKLDVTDFATPVKTVAASSNSVRSSLSIKASGEYDYLAYQADNEYVISVKPLTRAELEEKKAQFAYTGEKLSLNFQNIEVRSVLQLIADVTDLNLVASDTVKGNITLRLDNVPWDQALDLVLKTKGLDKRQIGNVLMVAPAAEIAERERQELETKKQLQELAPLRTEYIRVRYANARELFDLFIPQYGERGGAGAGTSRSAQDRNTTGSILSERGHAIVDDRTNSIILTDTEEKIAAFRKVIDQVDIPIRQVMIEARIVIANTDFRKELGAALFGHVSPRDRHGGNILTGKYLTADDIEINGDDVEITTNPFFDMGIRGDTASRFAWNIIRNNMFLGLELSALEDSGYAEIVSQPKVITGDKQQASIESGTEIPYRDATATTGAGGAGGGVAASISFKKALLRLDVTPQITPDDKIIMDLVINQDSPGENTSAGPTIEVTKLETQVLVPDGQTVVLGGIFQNNVLTAQSKVPFLGDIPVLGRLFRKDVTSEDKRELLIFITPRIMSNGVDD
ncbi:type IV pilus secretin PilQ [Saccharophagus sp. K07]|uniref:type IV pilus secretin PilQ n=1 Tax=Saccharophagus sp. K07 TaxID=2283636 RepID=UPI001651DBF8|nr:type IV pilus secretin PilQ [Saccharophagus sp. K07]MBC6905834.1 type IV pilus secretin PilQ [Saccharophagus sp. K07]